MKTIKIIDLLNKIANGEELPKKIKYKCDIYVIGEDVCNKDAKYINEKKDDDGYTRYLFQDWILDVILNDEVEILDEEDEFEDIEEYFAGVELEYNKNEYQYKINQLIKNQKKIIERLKKEGK